MCWKYSHSLLDIQMHYTYLNRSPIWQDFCMQQILFLKGKRALSGWEGLYSLDKIHGLCNSCLDKLLDVPLLLVREVVWTASRATRTSAVRGCKLVVVLPRSVCHQVRVVGRGGVGHRPRRTVLMHNRDKHDSQITSCNVSRGGRGSRRGPPVRQHWSRCHPTRRGNGRVVTFLGYLRGCGEGK